MHRALRLSALLLPLVLPALPATAAGTGFEPPARPWVLDQSVLGFQPLAGAKAHTGVTPHGSGYRIEIPDNWNGDLVVHSTGGVQFPEEAKCNPDTKANCTLANPGFPRNRAQLLKMGFAWMTHTGRGSLIAPKIRALDMIDDIDAFRKLRPEMKGRVYAVGASIGGLTVQTAVELFPKEWAGAMANCPGGDEGMAHFYNPTFAALALTAPDDPEIAAYLKSTTKWPLDLKRLEALGPKVRAALGSDFPYIVNEKGAALRTIVKNLSGGERPMYDSGYNLIGGDLVPFYAIRVVAVDAGNRSIIDNAKTEFRWQSKPGEKMTAAEEALNKAVPRFTCDAEVCTSAPVKRDQTKNLGGFHHLSGRLAMPVISLLPTGELMATMSGNRHWVDRVEQAKSLDKLTIRAIRAGGHCAFNQAEYEEAWTDLVTWVTTGKKAEGDDIRDVAAAAKPDFGCRFTRGMHEQDFGYQENCKK